MTPEQIEAALSAVQEVLDAAYHRGNGKYDVHGEHMATWSPSDEHIMKTLGPIERTLREAIRAEAAREAK